jgi:RAD51-like protein 3
MRLSSLSPQFLSPTLVDALRVLEIVSDADLFFSATPLELWRKLPPDLIKFSEFERCVKAVMLRCAVPGSFATELDKRSLPVRLKPETSSGINVLDNLLGATLRDSVVEISGRHGGAATVRPLSLAHHCFPLKRLCIDGGTNSKDARPTDRVQSIVFVLQSDRAVGRRDR